MVMSVQLPTSRRSQAKMSIEYGGKGCRNGGKRKGGVGIFQIVEIRGLFVLYQLTLDFRGDTDGMKLVDVFENEADAERSAAVAKVGELP